MKYLLMSILFTAGAFANSIEVVSESVVKHGDTTNVVLRLNNIVSESDIKKAIETGEKKLGPFYVHNVGFIKYEENNTVVGLNVFYDDPKSVSSIVFKLVPAINLRITGRANLDPTELNTEAKFRYYTRSFNLPSDLNYIYVCLGVVFFFLGGVFLKRYWDFEKIRQAEIEYFQNWVRAFKSCYKRSDYERIYKEREKWLPLVGRTGKKFIKILNKHQYKKEWSQSDMAQVTEEFNKLKDKLTSNGA